MIGMLFHSAQKKKKNTKKIDNSSYAVALDHEQQQKNRIPHNTRHHTLYSRCHCITIKLDSYCITNFRNIFQVARARARFISSIKRKNEWMNEWRKMIFYCRCPLNANVYVCVCVSALFLVYLFTWPKYISYDFRSRLTDSQKSFPSSSSNLRFKCF